MNINQRAIESLEENEYEDALDLFQEAVEESRDVQSLNNFAWMYSNEEHEYMKAAILLEEAMKLNPTSYFPYSLLGEIYIRIKKWDEAKEMLEAAINIQPTKTTYHNLAIVNYHFRDFESAAKHFLLASGDSDCSMYGYVKCLIELGKVDEAKNRLDTFSEDDEDFVGEIEVADLYVELGCYKEAIEWFKKGWVSAWEEISWVSRYVYSLLELGDLTTVHEVLKEVNEIKIADIKEVRDNEDDVWTESEKQEKIIELMNEKKAYEQLLENMTDGVVPAMEFDIEVQEDCYLFGCVRHNHPEYQD
ncbi:tetratricopeptide repeat protein [Viridibacillus arvi]|uniref:tetratricopeptide repeat protein n=1 Tax=Viridibacillus arvi TaxID=263475 RepID=UPI003D077790